MTLVSEISHNIIAHHIFCPYRAPPLTTNGSLCNQNGYFRVQVIISLNSNLWITNFKELRKQRHLCSIFYFINVYNIMPLSFISLSKVSPKCDTEEKTCLLSVEPNIWILGFVWQWQHTPRTCSFCKLSFQVCIHYL